MSAHTRGTHRAGQIGTAGPPVTPTEKRAQALSSAMSEPLVAETRTAGSVVWAARTGSA